MPDRFGHPPADALTPLLDDPERWPAQLAELADLTQDELEAHGRLGPDDARRLACRIVARLAQERGGSHWYVPKDDAIRRALRDLQLWADFDGTPNGPRGVRALARAHRLSEVAVYAILRQQRHLHRRRAHGDLFDAGP